MYIWNEKNKPKSLETGFYANVTKNYNGHKFIYTAHNIDIPPFFCDKNLKSFYEDQHGLLEEPRVNATLDGERCFGLDVSILGFASELFYMSWGFIAPGSQGSCNNSMIDNKTGRWQPSTYMNNLVYGKADVSLYMTTHSPGNRVLGATQFRYEPVFIFSAAPKKLSNALAVVYPFEPILWPAVLLTATVMSLVFYLLPNFQRKVDSIKGLDPKKETGVSIWFGYFALIGESMRDESVKYHRGPIR